ncbi:MAG: hypothetical protein KAS38_02100 [Anaerolineales bacterium]|nr:hypothetical protein [Anaerolineales bacterium]
MIQPLCLYCEKDSLQVPLLAIQYQGRELWICPQHLPILIHKPAQLADKLPGVENLDTPEGHAHD